MAASIVTRSELLVLANECCAAAPAENGLALMMDGGDLERFAAKIAEAEREACAKAAEEVDEPGWMGYECPNTFQNGKWAAAAAIRERGET